MGYFLPVRPGLSPALSDSFAPHAVAAKLTFSRQNVHLRGPTFKVVWALHRHVLSFQILAPRMLHTVCFCSESTHHAVCLPGRDQWFISQSALMLGIARGL